jgi:hypothetical protein
VPGKEILIDLKPDRRGVRRSLEIFQDDLMQACKVVRWRFRLCDGECCSPMTWRSARRPVVLNHDRDGERRKSQ